MFYRPENKAVCADVIPFYEDNEFKLFYLKDYRDPAAAGEGCDWNLLTTDDLVHYVDRGTVLPRGTKEEQDLYVYTGCCVKHNGEYLIFYTGHNPHKRAAGLPEQKILLAKSADLLRWHKEKDFVMEAPAYLEMHDFRDPFVFFDDRKGCFAMLIAAREKSSAPLSFKGVTLIAYSNDLLHWTLDEKPFFAPQAFFTHECPDLFRIGEWWYLIFSEFTDKYVTTYRMAKSPYGPWISPAVNTFDGHAFYAAKSVSDGNRRILFGWNPIKNHEKDHDFWQWGGNIIPHELRQNPDGTLSVRCPDEISAAYGKKQAAEESYRMGEVQKDGNSFTVGSGAGRSLIMFGKTPTYCKIEFDFTPEAETGDFGLLLNADFLNGNNTYYTVKFDPVFGRYSFDIWPRRDLANHTQTDTERPVKIKAGEKHRIKMIVEDSVVEIYMDDRLALGARMFEFRGKIGFYAMDNKVRFENFAVYTSD